MLSLSAAVKSRAKPLTIRQLNEAIALCQRPQGATTKDLQHVMRRASFDCPGTLRGYLYRYRPTLFLVSSHEPNFRLHGNTLRYRIISA